MKKLVLFIAVSLFTTNLFSQESEMEPDPEFFEKQFLVVDNVSSNLGQSNFLFATKGEGYRTIVPAKVVGEAIKIYARSAEEAFAAGDGTATDSTNNLTKNDDGAITNFADWDTQFFITFGEDNKLEAGDKLQLIMDVKADAATSVGTQSHNSPGGYIDYRCLGDVNFTTDWVTYTSDIKEVGQGPAAGMYTIAFGLAKGAANTFYFKNIKVIITKPAEQILIDEAEVVVNNTCEEGGDNSNYYVHEWRTESEQYSGKVDENNLVDGFVKVYVRSFEQAAAAGNTTLVDNYNDVTEDNFADWDSQFFIRFDPNRKLEIGDKIQLKMKVKADVHATVGTQSHAEPGEYLHWYGVGDVNFTTEWAPFESAQVEAASGQNWGKTIEGMHCIAFNLAKGIENNYYFDDIHVIVKKPKKYALVAEEEWNLLKTIYLSMDNTDEWKQKWDFSGDIHSTASLPGVNVEDGHIISINLSNNNLTGNFPFALLNLPYLRSFDVSANNLRGNIGIQTTSYMDDNPTVTFAAKTINISSNQFTGNLATFANCFADLESLDASGNCLEEVYPIISRKVNMLDISQQSISRNIPLHLANLSADFIAKEMPSIVLYNHINQTYSTDINLCLSTSNNSWSTVLTSQNDQISFPVVSAQNAYYGQSGDVLDVLVLNNYYDYYYYYNYGTRAGSTFQMALYFDNGDGNFDGQVNVLDLQTTLNYMFEEYTEKPYNFTASNLWNDDVINVQDAVCMVNLLLDEETSSSRKHNNVRRMNRLPISTEASVAVENGKLVINTAIPISSFDIVVSSDQEFMVESSLIEQGFNCISKQNGNQTHLIGYSLSGAQLPTGKNVIGETSKGQITYAMLADENACEIPCDVNGIATGIQSIKADTPSTEVYRLSLGTKHAISIDSTGKKTMIKDEK